MAVVNLFCGLFVFGILCGSCLATATDVDCSNQTSVLQASENCFSHLKQSLGVDIGQIQNAIQDNPDLVCSNPGAFKSGMSCALTLSRSCLDSAGVTTDILPQGDKISAGIDYLCGHIQDLDTECIQQTKPALEQCAASRATTLLSGNTNTNVTYITCKSYEIAVNCTRDILAYCANQTADILAYYAENYATPAVCGTGVLSGSWGVDGLDCTSKASLQRAQKQCFSQLGLSLGTDFDDIKNVIQKDPEVACRNPEQYRSALKCATDVAKICLASVGQSVDILPDTDKMTEGLTYMCARIHEVDMPCVQEKQDPMKQCAMAKALAAFSGNSDFDVKDITCKAFEIAVECAHDVLDTCGGQTETIYAYFTEHYLTPPACGQDGTSSDQGYKVSTAAPMTTVELFTVVPMLPEVSCYSQSSIQAGQLQCFAREGIHVQLPRVSIGGGQQSKQSYLDSVLSNNKDMHAVCRDLPRYQRALSCTMEVGRQCMPQGYKDYLPSASNMHRMMAYVCDNVDDIDQSCVTSKATDLFDCGYNKGMEHRVRDPKALLCRAFEWGMSCAREVLPPCGCKTTRIYTRISKEFLNPPACAPIEQPLPGCRGYSDHFVASPYGGAGHSAASAFSLVILAAFLSLFFRL